MAYYLTNPGEYDTIPILSDVKKDFIAYLQLREEGGSIEVLFKNERGSSQSIRIKVK